MQLIIHSERAFTLTGFLTASQCEALVSQAETTGFEAAGVRTRTGERAMPELRNNERVVFESPQWVALLWEELLKAQCLPELEGTRAVGLPRGLRFYKYSPGQRFKMHRDGPWHEDGLTSKLTFLVYLNDGFQGGATDFRDFVVTPKRGDALLFIHDIFHEGAAVTAGTKYVLRSDVLYSAAAGCTLT